MIIDKIIPIYCHFEELEYNTEKIKNIKEEYLYSYIEFTAQKLKNEIINFAMEKFESLSGPIEKDCFYTLEKIQSSRNQKFNTQKNMINHEEISDELKKFLEDCYLNQSLKYGFCAILKFFDECLRFFINSLVEQFLKKFHEIIETKTKNSFKEVIKKLSKNLTAEIKLHFPNNKNNNQNQKDDNNLNNNNDNFFANKVNVGNMFNLDD